MTDSALFGEQYTGGQHLQVSSAPLASGSQSSSVRALHCFSTVCLSLEHANQSASTVGSKLLLIQLSPFVVRPFSLVEKSAATPPPPHPTLSHVRLQLGAYASLHLPLFGSLLIYFRIFSLHSLLTCPFEFLFVRLSGSLIS